MILTTQLIETEMSTHVVAPAPHRRTPPVMKEFLSRVGHELRTPLNSVIGFAGRLQANRHGNQSTQDLVFLDAIRRNGECLLGVVENVLLYSRIVMNQITVSPSDFDLVALARDAVESRQGDARAKGLLLTLNAPQECKVTADVAHFVDAFAKVLDNAIKFTASGRVEVTILPTSANGSPRVEVRDTGAGIPHSRSECIFDPFTACEAMATRTTSGAGMGLPIARALCRIGGGDVTLQSEPGVGSIFAIQFAEPTILC